MLQEKINNSIPPSIIFRDEYFMVLNKPAGWVVNEAETVGEKETIQSWLAASFDFPIARDRKMRSGVVHRLDKETSGLLLIAKTEESFYELQRQFREREIKKTYLALVHSWFKQTEGSVDAPVGRNPFNREKFGIFMGGKEAQTEYRVVGQAGDKNNQLSLVELCPETGRTHQIRVHMKHIGHSLVGDDKYAGGKTARRDRKWCPRLFLHALSLNMAHPKTKEPLHFFAPLPEELQCALSRYPDLAKLNLYTSYGQL